MSSASLTSLRNLEASPGANFAQSTSPTPSASTTPHGHQFTQRTVETQGSLLGLATPASRPHGDAGAFVYLKKRAEEEKLPVQLNYSEDSATFSPTQPSPEFDVSSPEFILNFNEPLLPSRRHLILQVFGAVDNVSDLQVSSAALRIISAQSEAVQFEPNSALYGVAPSRIFSILQEEPGALQACLTRFKRRLEREETEAVQILADGRGFPSGSGVLGVAGLLDGSALAECSPDVLDAFGLTNLIRLQIVAFLAGNVQKRSYNLAHYLLGLNEQRELTDNASALQSSCLPLLIDMLTYGLGHASAEVPVLFTEHPALGVKVLQLLNALLPASSSVWKYLREERELFSSLAKHFGVNLSGAIDENIEAGNGNAIASANASVIATASATSLLPITYALLQRAELFNLLAMDIHEAAQGAGDVRYAAGVIEGLLAASGADCRLIAFIAEIDGFGALIAKADASSPFELAVRGEFLVALINFTQSWSLLTGRVLSLESSLRSEAFDPLLGAACEKLRSSLGVWMGRMMMDSSMPGECIESLVQLLSGSIGMDGSNGMDGSGSIGMDNVSTTSSTTTPSSSAITTALLRPDLSSSARCFLYSAMMKTTSSSSSTDDSLFKAIQIACKDVLSLGSRDEFDDSLVTVAAGCLEALLPVVGVNALSPSFGGQLIASLVMDDAGAGDSLPARGSAILKWKAKWSLLMALSVALDDGDGQLDVSFVERLKCVGSVAFVYRALEQADVFIHLLLPVLKFASLSPHPITFNPEVISKLLGKFDGFSVDALLMGMINRRLLESPAFCPEIMKIALKAVTTFVRMSRLGGILEAGLMDCLEEAFTFLARNQSSLSADFSCSTGNKLCLGHLTQILQFAQGSLLEKTLWLILAVLQDRLGFLLPSPGMTAVYLPRDRGLERALRLEAEVHLVPLLLAQGSNQGTFIETVRLQLLQLINPDTKTPIIQL